MCDDSLGRDLYDDPNPPREDEWRTRDGRVVVVSNMTDSHLLNTIRYLHRQLNACNSIIHAGGTWLAPSEGTIAADDFEGLYDEACEASIAYENKLVTMIRETERRRLNVPARPSIPSVPEPKKVSQFCGGTIYEF